MYNRAVFSFTKGMESKSVEEFASISLFISNISSNKYLIKHTVLTVWYNLDNRNLILILFFVCIIDSRFSSCLLKILAWSHVRSQISFIIMKWVSYDKNRCTPNAECHGNLILDLKNKLDIVSKRIPSKVSCLLFIYNELAKSDSTEWRREIFPH